MSEVTMVAVDGTDALAYVIIKPNGHGDGVFIEAAASGMSKPQGAYVLRHVAQQWDPHHDGEAELAAEREANGLLSREVDRLRALLVAAGLDPDGGGL
jgi:hypothetical protein